MKRARKQSRKHPSTPRIDPDFQVREPSSLDLAWHARRLITQAGESQLTVDRAKYAATALGEGVQALGDALVALNGLIEMLGAHNSANKQVASAMETLLDHLQRQKSDV